VPDDEDDPAGLDLFALVEEGARAVVTALV
jgi:hypothetical protein